jgi:hypothetical protein
MLLDGQRESLLQRLISKNFFSGDNFIPSKICHRWVKEVYIQIEPCLAGCIIPRKSFVLPIEDLTLL